MGLTDQADERLYAAYSELRKLGVSHDTIAGMLRQLDSDAVPIHPADIQTWHDRYEDEDDGQHHG